MVHRNKCRKCNIFFSTTSDYRKHYIVVHSKNRCSKCNIYFSTLKIYKKHYDDLHNNICSNCGIKKGNKKCSIKFNTNIVTVINF